MHFGIIGRGAGHQALGAGHAIGNIAGIVLQVYRYYHVIAIYIHPIVAGVVVGVGIGVVHGQAVAVVGGGPVFGLQVAGHYLKGKLVMKRARIAQVGINHRGRAIERRAYVHHGGLHRGGEPRVVKRILTGNQHGAVHTSRPIQGRRGPYNHLYTLYIQLRNTEYIAGRKAQARGGIVDAVNQLVEAEIGLAIKATGIGKLEQQRVGIHIHTFQVGQGVIKIGCSRAVYFADVHLFHRYACLQHVLFHPRSRYHNLLPQINLLCHCYLQVTDAGLYRNVLCLVADHRDLQHQWRGQVGFQAEGSLGVTHRADHPVFYLDIHPGQRLTGLLVGNGAANQQLAESGATQAENQ